MSYYQAMGTNYYNSHSGYNVDEDVPDFNSRSMLGNIEEPSSNQANNDDYDPDYDLEVNELLREVEEDIKFDQEATFGDSKDEKTIDPFTDPERVKYEDCYDEFQEDTDNDVLPEWYEKVLQSKVKQTKSRLEELSHLVCYASATTRNQIMRIERDHNTPFCKLDYPRHPPLQKPWLNYWRFNCMIKCKEDPPEPLHAHTTECETILLEHVGTGVTTRSKNISSSEFPAHVMHTVELFQEFAILTYHDKSYLDNDELPDSIYEKPMWTYIKIRSNYKNELMLIASGKGVTPLLKHLRRYFQEGPGRSTNVISLYCINNKRSDKKFKFSPTFITGCLELRDKVGPISINYNPKTNINFNAVEAQQLGKIMYEYLAPNVETTIVEIGCNFGVLSLMMAQKCDKVIGLNTLDYEIKMAEDIKSYNNIHNASFIVCTPKEVQSKCSPLVKKCISVAILNMTSPFGKLPDVMKALRNLPSIWRVVVYGSFKKEIHKHITILTSSDEHLGDEFLPMQGCILDKSPSNESAFEVIILFERKALIEPSIELIASGPTMNVKSDLEDPWSSNQPADIKKEEILPLKIQKGFGNDYQKPRVKNPAYKPFPKNNRPSRKYGRFDSPLLPMDNKPIARPIDNDSDSSSTSNTDVKSINFTPVIKPVKIRNLMRKFDCPPPPEVERNMARPPSPKPVSEIKQSSSSPSRSESSDRSDSPLLILHEKFDHPPRSDSGERSFNSPLPLKTENQHDRPPPVKTEPPFGYRPQQKYRESRFDCPSLLPTALQNPPPAIKQEQQYSSLSGVVNIGLDHSLQVKRESRFDCPPLPASELAQSYNQPSVKQERQPNLTSQHHSSRAHTPPTVKSENVFSSPLELRKPDTHFDSPPPLKHENHSNLGNQSHESLSHVLLPQPKVEPPSAVEKEEGELSPDNSDVDIRILPNVVIKPEPMDLDDDDEIEQQPLISLPGNVTKSEIVDSGVDNVMPIRIKSEPISSSDVLPMEFDHVRVKSEPEEPVSVKNEVAGASPITDIEDLQNMVTPVHVPAALAHQVIPSPVSTSTNFKTNDGFEFKVKPNQSFLSYMPAVKTEPVDVPAVSIKKETVAQIEIQETPTNEVKIESRRSTDKEKEEEEEEEEISIISVKNIKTENEKVKKEKKEKKKEKKEKKEKKREKRKSKDKDRDKNLQKEYKYKAPTNGEISDDLEDLRRLIEKQKSIQKQLERDSEYQSSTQRYSRSSSSSPKRGMSSSPMRRSPSPTRRRSPSPYKPRSPPPRAYKSPIRAPRSPPRGPRSPPRTYRSPPRGYRPQGSWDRRTTPPRYGKRSPPSPVRFGRRFSPPPLSRYNKRLPISPSFNPNRFVKRTPPSSSSPRFVRRSPPSPRYRRPNISPDRRFNKFDKRKSRSPPIKRRLTTMSPMHNSRSRSRSFSPSPSPPPAKRFVSQQKKSSVSASDKNEPDDEWDIPGLSTLIESSPERKKMMQDMITSPDKSSASSTSDSTTIPQKKDIS